MDGWMEEKMDRWKGGWVLRMGAWMDGWMDGLMDGWMDRWKKGWMDGKMNVLIDACMGA